jgi:predicted MPP superfamily phosphohydrolase
LRNRKIEITPLTIFTDKHIQERKIIFISDLHVDEIYGYRHLKRIVNHLLAQQPDIVLIGGDLINAPKENYVAAFRAFQKIKVPIYAVIGNHDVLFGPHTNIIERVFKMGGITPLRNRTILHKDLQIIGIDDKDLWKKKKKLTTILEECQIQPPLEEGKETYPFTILLTHRPFHLSKLKAYPIDLELAGHTHNGQVLGLNLFSHMINDYTYGKYTRNEKIAFVSQGLGAGIPFRLGTEGEIVVIELKRREK